MLGIPERSTLEFLCNGHGRINLRLLTVDQRGEVCAPDLIVIADIL
jgi:hypothetical protein